MFFACFMLSSVYTPCIHEIYSMPEEYKSRGWMKVKLPEKPFLSVNDVSIALGLSYDLTRRLFLKRDFPSIKLVGRRYVEKETFIEWLHNQ